MQCVCGDYATMQKAVFHPFSLATSAAAGSQIRSTTLQPAMGDCQHGRRFASRSRARDKQPTPRALSCLGWVEGGSSRDGDERLLCRLSGLPLDAAIQSGASSALYRSPSRPSHTVVLQQLRRAQGPGRRSQALHRRQRAGGCPVCCRNTVMKWVCERKPTSMAISSMRISSILSFVFARSIRRSRT